jgi:hypothetical protein
LILVDTSVWVEHLRRGHSRLARLLVEDEVAGHPFVTGELALGSLSRRDEILGLLAALPQAPAASHDEVWAFMETRDLFGRGIGWVDAHLLTAAALSGARLWTLDRRLAKVASDLALAARSET